MKKLITILFVVISAAGIGQKKKSKVNPIIPLAKFENISLELNKSDFNLIITTQEGTKETVLIKNIASGVTPKDCKITKFLANGTSFYNLTWIEKTTVGDPKTKVEETTKTINEVWDISAKTKVFSNEQVTTNIKEQVFLDRFKNASETQERLRKEGQEFLLMPDGVLVLKSKNSESRLAYSSIDKKFMPLLKKKKK